MARHIGESLDFERALVAIRNGQSSRQAGVDQGFGVDAVRSHARGSPALRRKFDEAMQARAEFYGEQIEALAESVPTLAKGEDGHAQVAAARLLIDTKKWLAAKMLPKIYGERIAVEHTGGVAVGVGLLAGDGDVREKLRQVFELGGGQLTAGEAVDVTAEETPEARASRVTRQTGDGGGSAS